MGLRHFVAVSEQAIGIQFTGVILQLTVWSFWGAEILMQRAVTVSLVTVWKLQLGGTQLLWKLYLILIGGGGLFNEQVFSSSVTGNSLTMSASVVLNVLLDRALRKSGAGWLQILNFDGVVTQTICRWFLSRS